MLLINKLSPGIKLIGNLLLHKHSEILGYIFIVCLCNTAQAEEISAFQVTDFGGSLSITSQTDKQNSVSQGGVSQTSESQYWQEKLSLNISSYAYHPNFLKMRFGTGLIFDQKTYDSSKEKNRVADLSARFDFLHKKPTPVSVYYNQTNIYTPTGLTDSFLLEQIAYGVNLGLHRPLSPVNTKLSASRSTSYGKNINQVTDETNERVKLDMKYSFATASLATINLSHQLNSKFSKSGSLALPITARETSSSTTAIKTRNVFGSENQLRLNSNAEYRKQDEFPERESWFFRPKLDWKHNKRFSSYYTYSLVHTDEQAIETENNRTTARLRYSGDDSLAANVGLSQGNNKSTGIKSESTGANFGIAKKIPVSYGKYSLAYSASTNFQYQTATTNLFPIFDDPYILTGVTQITINRDYIDTTTIIVTNLANTQTYVEGTDYTITTVGNQTLIERLITGNITDGQNVLIDYSYLTGGTYKKVRQSQNFNARLNIKKYYDLSIKLYKFEDILKEGIPTIELNSSDGVVLRLRADRPLKKGMTVGGKIQTQQHNEDKNPYNQQNVSAFINTPLYENSTLRLSTGLVKRDNENSDEDVNTKTLGLRISARPWTRVSMIFGSNYSQNMGGSSKRTRLDNNLDFHWRYRKLRYKATLKYQSEEQGSHEHDDLSIFMRLTRPF